MNGFAELFTAAPPAGDDLYVFQAGATIDVYDAASYKLLRTIEINADKTTNLFILPRK